MKGYAATLQPEAFAHGEATIVHGLDGDVIVQVWREETGELVVGCEVVHVSRNMVRLRPGWYELSSSGPMWVPARVTQPMRVVMLAV